MVVIKTKREIDLMREAGRISARALKLAGEAVEPGVTTEEIDSVVKKYIESQGATPSFLGYGGFPASACISVNNVVIHGIPDKKCVIHAGDIVSIDIGAQINGFHGDNAWTYPCGDISAEAQKLLDATKESLFEAINTAKIGARLGDIGHTVQNYVETRGYSVVRKFVGHGVGTKLHEDPAVPNYGNAGHGMRLSEGMTIAIEPMINMGSCDVKVLEDGWTTVTVDGQLSAHFEKTIAITGDGPIILTDPD
jgi:methionine aminopeptidase, type I